MSHGGGHSLVEGDNKKIAIVISILALFLAIVLASAYLITGAIYLLWGAFGLGGLGILFGLTAVLAPTIHLF